MELPTGKSTAGSPCTPLSRAVNSPASPKISPTSPATRQHPLPNCSPATTRRDVHTSTVGYRHVGIGERPSTRQERMLPAESTTVGVNAVFEVPRLLYSFT